MVTGGTISNINSDNDEKKHKYYKGVVDEYNESLRNLKNLLNIEVSDYHTVDNKVHKVHMQTLESLHNKFTANEEILLNEYTRLYVNPGLKPKLKPLILVYSPDTEYFEIYKSKLGRTGCAKVCARMARS